MQESRSEEGGALKENIQERDETVKKAGSETDEEEDMFPRTVAGAWSAELETDVSDLLASVYPH